MTQLDRLEDKIFLIVTHFYKMTPRAGYRSNYYDTSTHTHKVKQIPIEYFTGYLCQIYHAWPHHHRWLVAASCSCQSGGELIQQHLRWLAGSKTILWTTSYISQYLKRYWVPIPSPGDTCTTVSQRETLTDFSKHLEQVWQSSLLLLQDVLHLGLLLLLLCWRVNGEALQVAEVANDFALKDTNAALTWRGLQQCKKAGSGFGCPTSLTS